MKAPEILEVAYSLGGELVVIKPNDLDIIKITDPAPGIVKVEYTGNITEVIVSDQMVVRYRVDTTLVEVVDMDIANVS
jgi:hypothetical protein